MKLNLLKELALTDFKLRYKNSVLGYLWSLLKPLAIFGTLYFVYSIFIRFNEPYYPLFFLFAIDDCRTFHHFAWCIVWARGTVCEIARSCKYLGYCFTNGILDHSD